MRDAALLHAVTDLLHREAEYADERRWDEWLALFDAKAEFWIPAWDSEDECTSDPQTEISLMYYGDRTGLEDRVFRLRTGRSAASSPLPRTCHMVSNVRAETAGDGTCVVKANFVTHLFKHNVSQSFYGRYEYLLQLKGGHWVIRKKKILVLNDLIDTVLDIYSV
jgi:3-phenylpropionate/cinnamic acid dioxygenase small subunit